MKKQGEGVIVNIASISMVRPRPGLNAYIASKGAAVSFSQALAIELAEYGIRVNVVNPGPADTGMLGQFTSKDADIEATKDTIFKKSVPLGRLIQPIDIANSLVYLCSKESAIVTGSVLNVDGGRGI
jgi:3-oxoacyl-[acyl-carrier protein] reductase